MAEPLTLYGTGWRLEEHPDIGVATIMTRRESGDALAVRVRERFGAELPTGPARTEGSGVAFLGTGPGTWLALCRDDAICLAMAEWLGETATVTDQSGGYRLYRLSGPSARPLLQAGVSIDLDPPAFATGSVAVTNIAQVNAVLSRIDEAPAYDILVFRSYGASFRHWIEAAGAALAGPSVRS